MREGHSSHTAAYNALFRGLETRRPRSDRLFNDPLAAGFLVWPLSAVMNIAAFRPGRAIAQRFIDHRWPGVRPSVVARTRLIDDIIRRVVGSENNGEGWQVAVLGAGFDSRAHRLDSLRNASIFEVDHPDTQRAKRDRLNRSRSNVRSDIGYVATDFIGDGLSDALDNAGYDNTVPTIIVWEGVTNYLTADAVDATLRWCSTAAPGSRLIFTYVHEDVLTNPSKYVGTGNLSKSLARSAEHLTFGIDPNVLRCYLSQRGLDLETDTGATEYRQRYYGRHAAHMRGHEFYRVATARIGDDLAGELSGRPRTYPPLAADDAGRSGPT